MNLCLVDFFFSAGCVVHMNVLMRTKCAFQSHIFTTVVQYIPIAYFNLLT